MFADAHVFDKEYQGARTFIKELYSLLALKKNLHIYLGAYDTDLLKKNFPDSDHISFLKYKNRSGIKRLLHDIPSLLSQYKIDYAHFQYIVPVAKKCRYIVTIHDVIFDDFPDEFSLRYRVSKRLLYGRSASKADIVTTVSDFSKHSIQEHLNTKSKNIHVIPNSVNEKFFLPYDKEFSKRIIAEKYNIEKFILYVSRFEPRKNHIGLLSSYLDLRLYEKGYHLVLLGYKSLKVSAFDEAIAALPEDIKKFVFINHSVSDDDLLTFYRAASVFIYPSKAEGFGIPPLEAGALRIPVICSNTSAMSEFSFFGENHIDPTNDDLLRERLNAVTILPLSEEELEKIAQTIHLKYSWERSAEKFYRLLLHDYTTPLENKLKTNDQLFISQ